MTGFDQGYSRRTFLRLTGALGTTAALGGVVAACNVVGSGAKTTGTFNWMTWGDHWIQTQLDKIAKDVNISTNISELSGNAEGYAKLKEVKGQLDKMSADAMWVPNAYFKDGLVEPFDINSLKVSSQLYSFAREFPYWQAAGGGYMAYPFGWSPIMIYYDPAKVTGNPTDWQVLLDPKYKGRIVVENQPEEIVAYMARAAGIDKPYDLTDDQLTTVKGYLEKLKPNVLKFAQQATDSVAAMVSGEAWLITGNIGNEDRVKDGGGPEIKGYVPSEGTVGWHDGEMIVKEGANKSLILPFLEQSQQAELIAENFLVNGRPLFNEKAYKILTDQCKMDQADRYLYG
jgi:spermidine/putrescine-binding protein